MGNASNVAKTALLCVTTVCVLAVLGLSIATIIKLYSSPVSTTTPTSVFHYSHKPVEPSSPLAAPYRQVTDMFLSTINASADPCNDFYEFTCGNRNATRISFEQVEMRILDIFINQAKDPRSRSSEQPKPVQQMWLLYDACKNDNSTSSTAHERVSERLRQFRAVTELPFPLLDQTDASYTMPNPTNLAKAIGYLDTYGIDVFISATIDTNWRDPQSTQGYMLFFEQGSLKFRTQAYLDDLSMVEFYYKSTVMEYMTVLKPSLNQERLKNDVDDLLRLELSLVHDIMTINVSKAQTFNLFNNAQASERYPFIDWHEFMKQISSYASSSVHAKILSSDYNFIVGEPKMLEKLGEYLKAGKFTPQTIMNYLNFRLIAIFGHRLLEGDLKHREKLLTAKTRVGKPRYIRTPTPITAIHVSLTEYHCSMIAMGEMEYAHARVFVDALYPTSNDRNEFRNSAAKLIDSVILGFRSMIDELSWMSTPSKKGAHYKIDNIVKNVGYPDFIMDDSKLTEYYASLNISDTDSFESMLQKSEVFWTRTMFALLELNQTRRDYFNGPPVEVNAWYQDELNSITIPVAILQPPFYAPKWPASVNYGAIGTVMGHELTHGFDNNGVLWDGTGVYFRWMDNSSYASFNEMAACVVNEYGSFCPSPQSYGPKCVDGSLTEGENIADNGGMHAAHRAYLAFVEFNGPDPLLNDPIMSQFTHDQLFYLGFAQVWCASPEQSTQIDYDPHSPPLYRVLGTIQNNPSFREAFNCPLNSKYAPKKHCNVWTSEPEITYGIPEINLNSDLNVPPKKKVQPDKPFEYSADFSAIDMFEASMNISANPCTNFYEYVCGNSKSDESSFSITYNRNVAKMAARMESQKYRTPQTPSSLKKTIQFYDTCKDMYANFEDNIRNGSMVLKALRDFHVATGLQFSIMLDKKANYSQVLDKVTLAKAIGTLSNMNIDTLLTPQVDTDWMTAKHFKFYLDQNTLRYPKSYYTPIAWNTIHARYKNNTMDLFNHVASFLKLTLDETKLSSDVDDLFEFEKTLATSYSTNETVRRQFKRSYNNFTVAEAQSQFSFLDLPTYFSSLSGEFKQLADYFNDPNRVFIVMEPEMLTKLSVGFTTNKFKSSVVANYFFYRILMKNQQFWPSPKNEQALGLATDDLSIGRRRQKKHSTGDGKAPNKPVEQICVEKTEEYMLYANGRIFIDYHYPDQASKDNIAQLIGQMIANVKLSFRGMLNRLQWMDEESKKGAYAKLDNLRENIAFPPFITDNAQLDAYYNDLVFLGNDGYLSMFQKLQTFNFRLSYAALLNHTAVDRNNFSGPPGTVNAWYQPELNSITFPAGILQHPFYDANWPTALNYGALALVSGHELTHAFDDEGVQWNGLGQLDDWMSNSAAQGFRDMAKCVIDEYSGFCPLNGTGKHPSCINGVQTEGENIADNGGIHAAWNGYQNHITLNGPDPQLPDIQLSKFTQDQLFFMGFAQVWCKSQPSVDSVFSNLLTDPHSPALYRVLGTLQNFPQFQTAFNCPADLPYSPSKHCSVWVSNQHA